MKGEFYKMDFRAWNLGTVDLTLEQEAAYLRLCHAMYDARGPIPDTVRLLQGIFRCGNVKAGALVRHLIAAGKIERDDAGRLLNRRVMDELANRTRGSGPSPKTSVAGLTAGCASTDASVNPECGSSADPVRPQCAPGAGRVTTVKPLTDHDIFSVEKSREEEERENRGREGEDIEGAGGVLDDDLAARVAAAFGPSAQQQIQAGLAIQPDPAPEAPAGPKRLHAADAYLVDGDDGFRVTHEQVAKWQNTYRNVDVAAEVMGAAGWAIRNFGKDWFLPMQTWLAKKNREGASDRADRRTRVEVEVEKAGKPARSRHQW